MIPLAQPLGAILILWGGWLMLIGVRNWSVLGLLVVGGVLLVSGAVLC